MDVGSVLSLAGARQAQQQAAVQLQVTLHAAKDFQDLQKDLVAQLLASLPSVNPDGVGGRIDLIA